MNFEIHIPREIPQKQHYSNGGIVTAYEEAKAGICRCRQCGRGQFANALARCIACDHPLWYIERIQRDRKYFSVLFKDLTLEALERLPKRKDLHTYNPEELLPWEMKERAIAIRTLASRKRYYRSFSLDQKAVNEMLEFQRNDNPSEF